VILTFDDGSTTDLNLRADLRKAMHGPFDKIDPAKTEIFLTAAVDWFWETKQEPDAQGNTVPWSAVPATKGELGFRVIERLLHYQLQADQQGPARFLFRLEGQDTSKALRGEAALRVCNERARGHLLKYGELSLLSAALKFLGSGTTPEAREALEGIVDLFPESGTGWFWLGILLRREGRSERAGAAFHKAATLLDSPYLDRVKCPSCGWIPCGQPLWKCVACGEAIDVFEARGDCPKCSKPQGDTICLACGLKSAHASWWGG